MKTTKKNVDNGEEKLKELFLASIDGNEASYRLFLETVAGYLRRYVATINKSSEREDLVQEALLAIHLKKHTFNRDYPLLPWIFGIAKHKNIDAWRKLGSHNEQSWDDSMASEVAKEDVTPLEEKQIFDTITSGLNDKQKQMISLVKIQGYSLQEASKIMNMSVAAVKVSIHRCIKLLKLKDQKDE